MNILRSVSAAILYSEGATGKPKEIYIIRFNSLALQCLVFEGVNHDFMLAIMPIFHGFGLEYVFILFIRCNKYFDFSF